jgi:hypothetical protein
MAARGNSSGGVECVCCSGAFGGDGGLGGVQVGQKSGRMWPCGHVVGGGLVRVVSSGGVCCRRGSLCGVVSVGVAWRVRFVVGCCCIGWS